MSTLNLIHVRAIIVFGDTIYVKTPYILSFSVNKTRGQISTFSASVKLTHNNLANLNKRIDIYAGEAATNPSDVTTNQLNLIFSGYIKTLNTSPCWDDPSYVTINISGADILSELEHKKFTRRQTRTEHQWAKITGVSESLKSGRLKVSTDPAIIPTKGDIMQNENSTKESTPSNNFDSIPKVAPDIKPKNKAVLTTEYIGLV